MSSLKDVYLGFQLVKDYAEEMRQSLVEVDKGAINEDECIATFQEYVRKLTQLADDVLDVHGHDEKQAANGWRAMLREARARLKKQARDNVRWLAQKKALRAYATTPPEPGGPQQGELLFTNKAIAKMKAIQVTESDCQDVFYHGTVIKESMKSRKYNGYEIGVVFGRDKKTRQYIIFSAWKRERR